jgi:hypothetical protein
VGYFRRWYYDYDVGSCDEFFFNGCGGNGNNYQSKVECEETCKREGEKPFRNLESMASIRLEEGQEYRPPG